MPQHVSSSSAQRAGRAPQRAGGAQVHPVLGLQRSAGNAAVVQRLGRNRKKEYEKLKTGPTAPTGDEAVADVSIAVTSYAETRSRASLKENGHGWIEVELRKPWKELDDPTKGKLETAMADSSKRFLPVKGFTSVGFYPAKGMFGKGRVVEPEKSFMLAGTAARMGHPVGVDALAKLLRFIGSSLAKPPGYSFLRYNCTDWAVKALSEAGVNASAFLGKVTTKKMTSPNKVFKRIYERASLGLGGQVNTQLGGGEKRLIEDSSQKALTKAGGAAPEGALNFSNSFHGWASVFSEARQGGLTLEEGLANLNEKRELAGESTLGWTHVALLPPPELKRLEQAFLASLDLPRLLRDDLLDRGVNFGKGIELDPDEFAKLHKDLDKGIAKLSGETVRGLASLDDQLLQVLARALDVPIASLRTKLVEAGKPEAPKGATGYPRRVGEAVMFSSGAQIPLDFIEEWIDGVALRPEGVARFLSFNAKVAEVLGFAKLLGSLGMGVTEGRVLKMLVEAGALTAEQAGVNVKPGEKKPEVSEDDSTASEVSQDDDTPGSDKEAAELLKERGGSVVTLDAPWKLGALDLPAGTQVMITDRAGRGGAGILVVDVAGKGYQHVPGLEAWAHLGHLG